MTQECLTAADLLWYALKFQSIDQSFTTPGHRAAKHFPGFSVSPTNQVAAKRNRGETLPPGSFWSILQGGKRSAVTSFTRHSQGNAINIAEKWKTQQASMPLPHKATNWTTNPPQNTAQPYLRQATEDIPLRVIISAHTELLI